MFDLINPKAKLPIPNGLGWDLFTPEDFVLHSSDFGMINLGFKSKLPNNTCALLMGRQGLFEKGVDVFEFFDTDPIKLMGGIIGFTYTNEWSIVLKNLSSRLVSFQAGDKVAQFILIPVILPDPSILLPDPFQLLNKNKF